MNISVLGNISAEQFLREYWQKKPLLIRQAIPGFVSPIDGNELAGLSLESEVESRIVLEHGNEPWELRHGPFTEQSFAELPDSHWTLLVQATDQFVPEVEQFLREFDFLPRWRFDDVMISYAAANGGVGPHYDNYDVFLLQAEGRREWKTGQLCDADSKLVEHPDLRILAEFDTEHTWVLEPGDMLYLPPRVAHWGTALDNCMTWSFGYQAPSTSDALLSFTDYAASFLTPEQRYTDADLEPIASPHEIRSSDVQRMRQLLLDQINDEQLLLSWFGQYVTQAKYPEFICGTEINNQQLLEYLQDGGALARHPAARLAWSKTTIEQQAAIVLFASGNSKAFYPPLVEFIQLVCDSAHLDTDNLGNWLNEPEAVALLCELIKQGSLELINE